MGLIEFLIFVLIVVVICGVGSMLISQIPKCPAWVPQMIWWLGGAIILWTLLQATGILAHDPQLPHI